MGNDGQGVYAGFPPIGTPSFAPDGRRLHRFRTTSLKTLDICAERTRLTMTGDMPRFETDSTAMGTSLHAAAEWAGAEIAQFGFCPGLGELQAHAQDTFSELMADPTFTWVKVKEGGARTFINLAVEAFHQKVVPTIGDVVDVERAFGPLILHEDDERVIELVGTTDAVMPNRLVDWKTSLGKAWEAWEHERWDIQPTSYLWAAQQEGWLQPDDQGLFHFEFVIFERTRVSQVDVRRINVVRHQGDFDWLKERAVDTARLIEADLSGWPKNDNSALCSPKFCGAWQQCKGKFYQQGWPKPSLPTTQPSAAACGPEGPQVSQHVQTISLTTKPNVQGEQ